MTILAGIYCLKSHSELPHQTCTNLLNSLSRHPNEDVWSFKDDRCFLAKVDIGAYGEPARHVDDDGVISLLAGEPLLALANDSSWQSRTSDLQLLHGEWCRGDANLLMKAQGTFCAVQYRPGASLKLVADKLGIRPLYYWIGEKHVVFASSLRILEQLDFVSKKVDLQGLTEMAGLGLPLKDRTPYVNIFLLGAAEITEFVEGKTSRRQYWRWDQVKRSNSQVELLSRETYKRFKLAVARRIRNDRTTIAYLSGGLDSRCILGELVESGVQAYTFNFARPGTQDQIFGNYLASALGLLHAEVPKNSGDQIPDYSGLMAKAWGASNKKDQQSVRRPQLVWSGEGGSVALGHVHMSQRIVDLMRKGKTDCAIAEFLLQERAALPMRLFRSKFRAIVEPVLTNGIRQELQSIFADDPGRGFHLFLMLNDQRRKLSSHFENIDLHRLEFQLPFFDSSFLEAVLAIPIEFCLRHEFYIRWLSQFHPAVTSVPWQSYPGHEPCPLPAPELSYQWDPTYQKAESSSRKRKVVKEAFRLLKIENFPANMLSRRNLAIAIWLHTLGLRDYEYVIETARTYISYWTKCQR